MGGRLHHRWRKIDAEGGSCLLSLLSRNVCDFSVGEGRASCRTNGRADAGRLATTDATQKDTPLDNAEFEQNLPAHVQELVTADCFAQRQTRRICFAAALVAQRALLVPCSMGTGSVPWCSSTTMSRMSSRIENCSQMPAWRVHLLALAGFQSAQCRELCTHIGVPGLCASTLVF